MFVPMVVCILIPRFALSTALGTRAELVGEPIALAPEPDREQVVGEVSIAAEGLGVHAGMRLGEALARCPRLRLVTPDPDAAAVAWETVLAGLEALGAMVEPAGAGEAYFEADGLRRLCGGSLEGVLSRARRAVAMPARLGAGPSRFCAFAAASRARPGRAAKIVPSGAERAYLAPLPVSLLRARPEAVAREGRVEDLCTMLERLGVRTLGELAAVGAAMVADRFGRPGALARELAHGRDTPLRPRPFRDELVERLELPEAVSGQQLERTLELLIDTLLARPERRGRSFRKLRLGARFVEQGTWRREVTMREATVARERLRLALAPRLSELPAPIDQLALGVVAFGPPVADQLSFHSHDEHERRKRLGEALRQTRAAAGQDSLLRVLEIDPGSRIPERRTVLAPFPE
jgi:protein ImuB